MNGTQVWCVHLSLLSELCDNYKEECQGDEASISTQSGCEGPTSETSSSSCRNQQSASPNVEVHVAYKKYTRKFKVNTPSRKRVIKNVTRKSFTSISSQLIRSPSKLKNVLSQLSRKIKQELTTICSDNHDSILRDTCEAVKHFSWETVSLELQKNVPTLMALLKQIVPKPTNKVPMLCFVASVLLQARHQRMCLVQRAISVMMYGNGTAKQVFSNFRPLRICMSYQGTMNIIETITEDHDIEIQTWCDELRPLIQRPANALPEPMYVFTPFDEDEIGDDIEPPPFSPISEEDFYDDATLSMNDTNSQQDDSSRNPQQDDYTQQSSQQDSTRNDGDEVEDDIEPPPFSPISEDDFHDHTTEEDSSMNDTNSQQDDSSRNPQHDDSISSQHSSQHDNSTQYSHCTAWSGFKFVGDNIDKNIRPRYQRHNDKGQSLHYFHGYAALDRVDMSKVSDIPPTERDPDYNDFKLSQEEVQQLKEELGILVSRIIVCYLGEFKNDAKHISRHIASEYKKEMSSKSKTVPFGVLLLNENKLDEMSQILDTYMDRVPTEASEGLMTLPNGDAVLVNNTMFLKTLFGGDQLTVARIRGAQALRDTHSDPADRFEGIAPVIEDWHSRMTLMKVIWGAFYDTKSSGEKGTMYNLRNVIHRTNVPSDPQKNMNSCEDFMLLLVHSHVVEAANTLQQLSQTKDISELTSRIISTFLRIPDLESLSKLPSECNDNVYLYGTDLLTIGLIWHGFHDAVKEGDGKRILRYWKLLLIIFKVTGHRNYAKEAIIVLDQYYRTFSERQKTQLLWSRCINTQGVPGANIPCDLHMEHLNRRLKTCIRNMGANVSSSKIVKAGKAIATLHHVCNVFEKQTVGHVQSGRHNFRSFGDDLTHVVKVLREVKTFTYNPHRIERYVSFKKKRGILERITTNELIDKIKTTFSGM
ncbi:uncharacterized protein LOC135334762 isoform X4 [Halichondria panicea]|uniref:uncharacterized protein LOC135334762 isoform X4 n=1 Tax=Halichondria panicea TaxID=6063 RepID=UPI00312B4C07